MHSLFTASFIYTHINHRTVRNKLSTHLPLPFKFLFSASKNQLLNQNKGSVLLCTLLFFSTGLFVFLVSVSLLLHSRDRIALKSKLDINTVRLVMNRKGLHKNIKNSNKILKLSGLAIIANTTLRPFSGPFGALSLQALKKIHRSIYLLQNIQWKKAALYEFYLSLCPRTIYSKNICICKLLPKLSKAPQRAPSPFPGVYGEILIIPQQVYLASCREKNEQTKIQFQNEQERYLQ